MKRAAKRSIDYGFDETNGSYRANTRSLACPIGYSQEETIKKIWEHVQQ